MKSSVRAKIPKRLVHDAHVNSPPFCRYLRDAASSLDLTLAGMGCEKRASGVWEGLKTREKTFLLSGVVAERGESRTGWWIPFISERRQFGMSWRSSKGHVWLIAIFCGGKNNSTKRGCARSGRQIDLMLATGNGTKTGWCSNELCASCGLINHAFCGDVGVLISCKRSGSVIAISTILDEVHCAGEAPKER